MHHQLAKLLYSFNKFPREMRRYWRVLSKHKMLGVALCWGCAGSQATAPVPAKGSKAHTRVKG